tara:strand:+ start:73 stop:441 length:369 start_codon:yes stop_codon:yes gene_type:complete
MNEENKILQEFLTNYEDGKEIFKTCHNSNDLEEKVRDYHTKKGIPNWEFEDNYDEGIDWITFGDVYNEIVTIEKIDTELKTYLHYLEPNQKEKLLAIIKTFIEPYFNAIEFLNNKTLENRQC